MSLAACSWLSSRDLALVGVFSKNARSSAYFRSEIVSVKYCLLLSPKLFPFIRSIDIRGPLSRQIMNRNRANEFPRQTPAKISKKFDHRWWTNHCLIVFDKNHCSYNNFLKETFCLNYLLHFSFLYRIKYEMYTISFQTFLYKHLKLS